MVYRGRDKRPWMCYAIRYKFIYMKNKILFTFFSLFLAFPATAMATGAGNWLINNDLSRPHKLYCTQRRMIDRIRCRLSMNSDELAQEMSIQFLPEQCRAVVNKKSQAACVAAYKLFKSCTEVPAGDERWRCVKDALAAEPTYDTVDTMVKFKLTDLIDRAKATLNPGSDINPVVNLENSLELIKQQYNKAKTLALKKQALVKAAAAWKKYVASNEAGGADDGLSEVLELLK